MPKPLVIVESPAKAKTISKFLGDDYLVESSIGHIRDLPKSAAEIPASLKKEPWSRLGVDVEHGFKPLYIIPERSKTQVKRLKSLLANASEVLLATDEDREGESIAWHLAEVLSPKVPVRRMVFHEITKPAILEAIGNTRAIDQGLVNAQEARRILDRLYGYEVSPVLWKKIKPALSAGRVQSVATRIIVERERERMKFRSASYFSVMADSEKSGVAFSVNLTALDDYRIASGKDFSSDGLLREKGKGSKAAVVVLGESDCQKLEDSLRSKTLEVLSVEEKPYRRSPAPPFRTSTLQQEAARKLHFSSKRTMAAAQRLYEDGLITYMRTDSTYLADVALQEARSIILDNYGADFLPAGRRDYRNAVKNAQEAHEAIRPAGERWKHPRAVVSQLRSDEAKLYELIWKRTVASQMTDATGTSVSVKFSADISLEQTIGTDAGTTVTPSKALFSASGRTISHFGFLRVYVETSDDSDAETDDDLVLPSFTAREKCNIISLRSGSHNTTPPARFTEATLIKYLEELGVGRPSTYSTIISTILDRGYAFKKGTALVPSFVAFAVVGLLEQYFSDLVDYNFTAGLEDSLDKIANGDLPVLPYLQSFYFGDEKPGLKALVDGQLDQIDPRAINSIELGVDGDGVEYVLRVGRYGPFLQIGDKTIPVPDGIAPDELTVERAKELVASAAQDKLLGVHPDSGEPIFIRIGRFGPFFQQGDTELLPKGTKPKTSSLLSTMSPHSVTLEDAMVSLSFPRVIGQDPQTKQDIIATTGKFGPYVKRGPVSRNLESDSELLSIELPRALELLNQPQAGKRRSSTSMALGIDPDGNAITLRSGTFGPYVSDGKVNCSVKQYEVDDGLTLERAVELLAEKRSGANITDASDGDKESVKRPRKPPARKRATPSKEKASSIATLRKSSSVAKTGNPKSKGSFA